MDKETELLLRLAANHLHLAQFEPFRAVLLTLRTRNPDLARSLLQTLVACSGRLDEVLWSRSCPNPSFLAYSSALELLKLENASSVWAFDSESLRLRVEFLLYVQILIDRVSARIKETSGEDSTEKGEDVDGELRGCVSALDKLLELGARRLKAHIPEIGSVETDVGTGSGPVASIEKLELIPFGCVLWEFADIFDALCLNVKQQLQGWAVDDSDQALTVHKEGRMRMDYLQEEEDAKVMGFVLNTVQLLHLDSIKKCVGEGDDEGAISRLRFLHLDHYVEDEQYRYGAFDLYFLRINEHLG